MIGKDSLERELPKGLIQWYRFRKGARALFVTGGQACFDVLPDAVAEWEVEVDCIHREEITEASQPYDYIVLAGAIEQSKHPESFLKSLHGLLASHGVLLIGADNRLGIRYLCGDRDPFTEKNFDGIENYQRVGEKEHKKLAGRTYSKAELARMLELAGFGYHRFYSVLPEWTRPQILCREDCAPQRNWKEMVIPQYHSPDTVFLEEEWLYDTWIENGLFHSMSNGYLIECPLDGCFADADQVTVSIESGKEEALAAIRQSGKRMIKRALYREGAGKLERIITYALDLKAHGVQTAKLKREEDSLVTPTMFQEPDVQGKAAIDLFRKLLCEDKDQFLKMLDRFLEVIRNSSEPAAYEDVDWEHFDPDWNRRKKDDPEKNKWKQIACGCEGRQEDLGLILKKGYMDLIPSNCVYVEKAEGKEETLKELTLEGEFVFFNQEHCLDMLPLHAIYIRIIDSLYWGPVWGNALIPKEELLERYHLKEYQRMWRLYVKRFTETIHGEQELLEYNRIRRRDRNMVNANRYRMNYSEKEYQRVFKDIFKGADGRKIYLFGSGVFAEKFLEQFGEDYEIAGILDNNPDRWGMELGKRQIVSPKILKSLPEDSYKVIICIKNCVPIMRQLKEELGVSNYSVYDWHQEYPRKLPGAVAMDVRNEKCAPKKYHIGYIAGVFDLFHVGHLNMFKRAKEQCDYLIVGVVSDESVMVNKKTMPYMPFEERLELVQACRYVDEAVGLPTYNGDTDEAHRRYQFDVQFSGSDYANDPVWLAKKEYLEKRGADLVFFPYTQSTSSTKLKEMIEKKLL